MPAMFMDHSVDPVMELRNRIKNLDNIEIFNNQVLVAIYVRPDQLKSGLYVPDSVRDEDKYQGKVGLVLKMGPTAFVPEEGENWFKGMNIRENDWIIFRPSDGWQLQLPKADGKSVICRVLQDTAIRARVTSPDDVY